MACQTSYAWSHNFPRLAAESGFTFSAHRPRVVLDWNRIRLIDIDSLIRERNFQIVEQHINDVLDCTLESEFDVRILDAGVVKLFRLAQLAVDYQQFCRQYLDRSVVVLRDELAAGMQELEKIRREIRNKDEEIRKLRRKSKSTHRSPLPYGNENIATMILRTLSNRGDIFAGTSIGEAVPQYNKCQHCDKVFLNQLYLQSHISRRHSEANQTMIADRGPIAPNDLPVKMSPTNEADLNKPDAELLLLKNEVKILQEKLRETESLLSSKPAIENSKKDAKDNDSSSGTVNRDNVNEINFMVKFEEWKKQENDKYHSEISDLRKQLIENMNMFKETALSNVAAKDDQLIDQLKDTVKNQEQEIIKLKEGISKVSKNEANEVSKEIQQQEEIWRGRMETLEKQHEHKLDQLLRTLETVYKEVKAAREMGEAERAKVLELQALLTEKDNAIRSLQEETSKNRRDSRTRSDPNLMPSTKSKPLGDAANIKAKGQDQTPKRVSPETQHHNNITSKQTLAELHRKAQELLNGNVESDSDSSDSPEEISSPEKLPPKNRIRKHSETTNPIRSVKSSSNVVRSRKNRKKREATENRSKADVGLSSGDNMIAVTRRTNGKENIKLQRESESESEDRMNGNKNEMTSSPVKVMRAKLSEEVNSRLLTLGVDPLRSGVPADTFKKQRTLLQHNTEIKAKKDAAYSKMRNRIMTYLDSKVSKETELSTESSPKVSPSKQPKNFRVSSILSNVKHKALSFMKTSERVSKVERNVLNDEISKKAALLLKTPPGSAPSSPTVRRRSSLDSRSLFPDKVKKALSRMTSRDSPTKTPPKSQSVEVLFHKNTKKMKAIDKDISDSDEATSSLEDYINHKNGVKVVTSVIAHEPSKSIENLIKSPIRKPTMFNGDGKIPQYSRNIESGKVPAPRSPARSASATPGTAPTKMYDIGTDSDEESDINIPADNPRKFLSEETLLTRSSPTSTKGVLKNAPSISSLSKKKVLFDLEANQMKSVSASPSQSVTDGNEAYKEQTQTLGNDWEISSIEDVPVKEVKTEETFTLDSRRSPKIAELTERIESQLARRPDIKKPIGAIEVMTQNPSVLMSGSNTSVGSSMLDDSNESEAKRISPGRSKAPVPAPRYVAKPSVDKDASDLDVSDWSIDDILKGK